MLLVPLSALRSPASWILQVRLVSASLVSSLTPSASTSPSMYGTVLDQRVFEHLVERCLPSIHEHFVSVDVQLSVASLPWFLSCFIASMPMVFAFRWASLIQVAARSSTDFSLVQDYRLLLPHGSEGLVPGWVGQLASTRRALLMHLLNRLAILKINGDELLATTDDGMFIK